MCIHEPFSDAYHWGPEKISARYDDVEKRRQEKGFIQYTYRTAFTLINDAKVSNPVRPPVPRGASNSCLTCSQNKRVFVKDMAKCLMPLEGNHSYIVPSLLIDSPIEQALVVPRPELGTFNPTVVPLKILSEFHFTFLIRNPLRSIPSLYKCSIPPKSLATGWHGFKPSDAGYREMRILFDYLRSVGQIGPHSNNEICVVDADDLLRFPEEVLRRYCLSIHLPFTPSSMHWDKERDQQRALDTFKNWAPFHDVALHSTCLKPSSSVSNSLILHDALRRLTPLITGSEKHSRSQGRLDLRIWAIRCRLDRRYCQL